MKKYSEFGSDVRMVIWNGDKFLYLGRKDFLDASDEVKLLDGSVPVSSISTYIPLVPSSVRINHSFNSNSAQITFRNPRARNLVRSKREKLVLDEIFNLFSFLLERSPDYYFKKYESIFSPSYYGVSDLRTLFYSTTSPVPFIMPAHLIFIDYFDPTVPSGRELGVWVRVFTGVVTSYSFSKSYDLTISAVSGWHFLERTVLISKKYSTLFSETKFPEKIKGFLKVYYGSVLSKLRSFNLDVLSDLSPIDLFNLIGETVNVQFGGMTDEEIEKLKGETTTIFKIEDSDIKNYKEVVSKNRFYKFKLFGKVDKLDNKDVSDLYVEEKYSPSSLIEDGVFKIKITPVVYNIRDFSPFKKVWKLSTNFYTWEDRRLSEVVLTFSKTFSFLSYFNEKGELIIREPPYNLRGKLIECIDVRSWNITGDSSNISTSVFFQPYIQYISDLTSQETSEAFNLVMIWEDPDKILKYGDRRADLPKLWADLSSSLKDKKLWIEFLKSYAEASLKLSNASSLFTFNFETVESMPLKLCDSFTFFPLQKSFICTSYSLNFTPRSTSLAYTGSRGKDVEEVFPEPWGYIVNLSNLLLKDYRGESEEGEWVNYALRVPFSDPLSPLKRLSEISQRFKSYFDLMNDKVKSFNGKDICKSVSEGFLSFNSFYSQGLYLDAFLLCDLAYIKEKLEKSLKSNWSNFIITDSSLDKVRLIVRDYDGLNHSDFNSVDILSVVLYLSDNKLIQVPISSSGKDGDIVEAVLKTILESLSDLGYVKGEDKADKSTYAWQSKSPDVSDPQTKYHIHIHRKSEEK